MHVSRGLVAGVLALVVSGSAVSCGGGDGSTSSGGTGGTPSTGGAPTTDGATDGAPDAGDGGSTAADSGTGGSGFVNPYLTCGNGTIEGREECDDGNRDSGDGCDGDCRWHCIEGDPRRGNPVCTNGYFCDGQETCSSEHKCVPAAQPLADGVLCGEAHKCKGGVCLEADKICGDGLRVTGEECDDGNLVGGDGCDADCMFSCVSSDPTRDCHLADTCPGDTTCDDKTHLCGQRSPLDDFTPCGTGMKCISGVCRPCGDGVKDLDEECDDGNSTRGDGCEPDCRYTCKPDDPTRDCTAANYCDQDGTCQSDHKCSPLVHKLNGTSCGSQPGKNCIAGGCVPANCGDGIVALGYETCDDANLATGDGCEPDCKPTCGKASDCTGTPACNVALCSNSQCSYSPDASNTSACSTGGGSATCKNGACTTGTCGDGVMDQGEQCDLGTAGNGPNTGCEKTCLFSCQTNADCDDGDACNGTEFCDLTQTDRRKCATTPNSALADLTACATGRICRNGGCAKSYCGDNYTDEAAGEGCDPPNTIGCDADCKPLEVCNLDKANFATKTTIKVSWGGGGAILPGTGEIHQWTLVNARAIAGTTDFTVTLKPCGIDIPDFQAGDATGREWYGIDFPDSIWDTSTRTFGTLLQASNLSPGAEISVQQSSLTMGLTLNDPFGAWPSWDDLMGGVGGATEDIDGDGHPGLTVHAKTGNLPAENATSPPTDGVLTYDGPLVNVTCFDGLPISDTGEVLRAVDLYLSIRASVSQQGTLVTCDEISGTTKVSYVDNHVVGCHKDAATLACVVDDFTIECLQGEARDIADSAKPVYDLSQGATFISKRMTGTPTCAGVRALVP